VSQAPDVPTLSYSSYLHVPELLSQQECLAEPPAHDELQFIIVHQVYELWFKLVLFELDAVNTALQRATGQVESEAEGELRAATRLCRRVVEIFRVLVPQIHVLESMRPVDFLAFRSRLNPASGFQSAQFREVEFVMGLKNAELIRRLDADPRLPQVQARFDAPSIADNLYRLLAARGLPATAPGAARTDTAARDTLEALRAVYEHPDDHHTLYELFEALLDVDEQIVLWRRHHVVMVERQIGDKPGTGKGRTGDLDGIRYLRTTLDRFALPDLWAVRGALED
jgi:tryptophan 2,3-dioxygenase